jgi:hypothetical protein
MRISLRRRRTRLGWPTAMLVLLYLSASAVAAWSQDASSANTPAPRSAPVSKTLYFSKEGLPAAPAPRLLPDRSRFPDGSVTNNDGSSDNFQVTTTPFTIAVSLPLVNVWRGKLQVRGFDTIDSMENYFWGLPGSGSLPAWSMIGPSHVLVQGPQQVDTYGLALSLHPSSRSMVNSSVPMRLFSRMLRIRFI